MDECGEAAKEDHLTQKCLLVLGMHRSGTSAISGILHCLGVDFGKSIVEPSYDNLKGFFENSAIQNINNQLLTTLGVSWDYPDFLPANWWEAPAIKAFQYQAQKTIKEEFEGATFFAIKDPRMCYLFPFWEEILLSLNISIHCLLTIRAPSEVAESLHKRNGFEYSKSHLIHLTHLFTAEQYSRSYPRIFVKYAEVIKDSIAIASKIKEFYSLDSSPWKDKVAQFISKDLQHHATSNSQGKFQSLQPYQVTAFLHFDQLDNSSSFNLIGFDKKTHQKYLASQVKIKNNTTEKGVSLFNMVYYLFQLVKSIRIKSVGYLIKSILLHPITFIRSIRGEHIQTLRKALKHEPPEVIVKNIIKLIRNGR